MIGIGLDLYWKYYGEEVDKDFAEDAIPEIERMILSLKNEFIGEI